MIRHTVVFRLNCPKDSLEEVRFLTAAAALSNIEGVEHFECLKQVSKKNNFDFGISMEFSNQHWYDEYSSHPEHLQFIENFWLKYVAGFLEIDYEPLKRNITAELMDLKDVHTNIAIFDS